eukprot:scaffold4964_cov248-Ochromonas_danica.AAC.4
MTFDNPIMDDDVDLVLKPKSRRAWRRAHPIPRILKRDVRRDFPMMITNVLNSGDNQILGRFFTSHCAHSCDMSSVDKGNACGRDSSLLRIHGLNESYIKQYLDKAGCQLIVTSRIRGTRVRDFLQTMAQTNNNFIVLSNDFDEFIKGWSPDYSSNGVCQHLTEYTLDLIVATTYWLDNNNRIYRIETECDNYKMDNEGSCSSELSPEKLPMLN